MKSCYRNSMTAFLGSLLALAAGGCGSGSPDTSLPKTVAVTGKVVVQGGTPLTGGLVQFVPVHGSAHTVMGEIRPGGHFELITVVGRTKVPGAVEGDYQVTVLPVTKKSQIHAVRWDQKAKVVAARDNHVAISIALPN